MGCCAETVGHRQMVYLLIALSKATRLWRRMIATRDAHQCRLSMWYQERPAGASQWIYMSAYQESFFIKNGYKITHILALDTISHFDDEVILYRRLRLSPSGWIKSHQEDYSGSYILISGELLDLWPISRKNDHMNLLFVRSPFCSMG